MQVFLIGGGRDSAAAHASFAAAVVGRGPVVVYLLDEPDADPERWSTTLTEAGVQQVTVIVVSPERPALAGDLAGAVGVYVAGGLTPGYRDVLVDGGPQWLDAARSAGIPYAGFSAGSAIAPSAAVVGGWRTRVADRLVEVSSADNGEDLDEVTLSPGLGLVPFLVDVHAAQWGTLHRLLYAVLDPGSPGDGWAIDEGTVLEVLDGVPVAVHGTGAATRVQRTGGRAEVSVHLAGRLGSS